MPQAKVTTSTRLFHLTSSPLLSDPSSCIWSGCFSCPILIRVIHATMNRRLAARTCNDHSDGREQPSVVFHYWNLFQDSSYFQCGDLRQQQQAHVIYYSWLGETLEHDTMGNALVGTMTLSVIERHCIVYLISHFQPRSAGIGLARLIFRSSDYLVIRTHKEISLWAVKA